MARDEAVAVDAASGAAWATDSDAESASTSSGPSPEKMEHSSN